MMQGQFGQTSPQAGLFALLGLLLLYFLAAVLPYLLAKEKPAGEDLSCERCFSAHAGPERASLIDSPQDYFNALLEIAESAEKTLDVSVLFIRDGAAADIFLGALAAAAQRGVRVRLLLDGLHVGLSEMTLCAPASAPDLEIGRYNRLDLLKPWLFNTRLHDKYMIADDRLMLVFGGNIADYYFPEPCFSGNRTLDRGLLVFNTEHGLKEQAGVVGDVLRRMESVWASPYIDLVRKSHGEGAARQREKMLAAYSDWKRLQGVCRRSDAELTTATRPTNRITFLASDFYPGVKPPRLERELYALFSLAEKKLAMQSPYAILDSATEKLLCGLNEKGVETELLVSSAAGMRVFDLLFCSIYLGNRRKLVRTRAALWEYQSADFAHMKSFVVDDRFCAIGSFNLCYHSYILNSETMLVVDSPEIAAETGASIERMLARSLRVGPDGRYQSSPEVSPAPVSFKKKLFLAIVKYPLRALKRLF